MSIFKMFTIRCFAFLVFIAMLLGALWLLTCWFDCRDSELISYCEQRNVKKVHEILDKKPSLRYINRFNSYGRSALLQVTMTGDYEIIKLLVEHGADVNLQNSAWRDFPLIRAADYKTTKLLIEHGANVNLKDSDGEFALLRAGGNYQIAKLLLEHGADVNMQNYSGDFALIQAVKNNKKDIIELLLKHGADVNNYSNKQGITALDHAIKNNNQEIIELLKSRGAKTAQELGIIRID